MVVWILLNLMAGSGGAPHEVLDVIEKKLASSGATAFRGAFGRSGEEVTLPHGWIADSLDGLIKRFSKVAAPDLIIGIGGDGTMNAIANAVVDRDISAPLMGIGVGTGNVGPLVRFDLKRLRDVDLRHLDVEPIGALEVISKRRLGYAFVDVVISRTFLGTLDGRRVDFDAVEYVKSGELKEAKRVKRKVTTERFTVEINGEAVFRGNRGVKQIAAAPLYKSEFYVGKAATGILCYAHHTGKRAVVVLGNHPTIVAKPKLPKSGFVMRQIVFGEDDLVTMKGFAPENAVVLDGNPVAPAEGAVSLRYRGDLVKVVIPPDGSFLPLAVV